MGASAALLVVVCSMWAPLPGCGANSADSRATAADLGRIPPLAWGCGRWRPPVARNVQSCVRVARNVQFGPCRSRRDRSVGQWSSRVLAAVGKEAVACVEFLFDKVLTCVEVGGSLEESDKRSTWCGSRLRDDGDDQVKGSAGCGDGDVVEVWPA